jgi:DNA (cytosine-5)-methyltransferase 1
VKTNDQLTVLDLFCGQGALSLGYFRAGFRRVIGIDTSESALKRYPDSFERHQMDWQEGLKKFGNDADLIIASPPCQHASQAVVKANKHKHPNLVPGVQYALRRTGKPYVIENVPGAKLRDPVELCGCMFDMHIEYQGTDFALYRRRLFESNMPIWVPLHEAHKRAAMPVLGHGVPGWFYKKHGYGVPTHVRNALMGTPWMTEAGCSEAVPPIFGEFIGLQVRMALDKGWNPLVAS